MNKLLNADLKDLVNLKIKLCGKMLYPTENVKYLDVKIEIPGC